MKLTKKQLAAIEKIKSIITHKMRYEVTQYMIPDAAEAIIDTLAAGSAKYVRNHLIDLLGLRDLADQIRQVRASRKSVVIPMSGTDRYRQRQAQLTGHRISAWCQRMHIHYGCRQTKLEYRHEVVWAMSGWCKRHNKPAAQYDELIIWVAEGGKTAKYDKKTNTLKIGCWEWRKNRGHSLSVRFVGTAEQASEQWNKVDNQEQRRAIIAAHGEAIVFKACKVELLQADDFGRLYRVQPLTSGGRPAADSLKYVRVVCPTTGAIYWLACEPRCETAKQAVAASFGMRIDQYNPVAQA